MKKLSAILDGDIWELWEGDALITSFPTIEETESYAGLNGYKITVWDDGEEQ